MNSQKFTPYILLHLLLLLYSTCGIFSKNAAAQRFLSPKWILLYGCMIMILGIYAICWQQLLKHIPLNIAYVNKSVTLVWTMLFGAVIFDEKITVIKIAGALLVIAGSILITTSKDPEGGDDI